MEVNTDLNNTMALEKRMLSIKDLSDYLGVSPQTIYNRLSAGTFPIKTKRIGRRLEVGSPGRGPLPGQAAHHQLTHHNLI